MDFGFALKCMAMGVPTCRNSWENKTLNLRLVKLETKGDHPIKQEIFEFSSEEIIMPWDKNTEDILATDWVEFTPS